MLPRTLAGWLTALVILAGVLGLTRLGVWQLSRHEEKQAQQAQIQERHDQAPLGPEALDRGGEDVAFHRVQLQGRFDPAQHVLIAGRYRGGQAGYQLVQPLTLDDGRAGPLVDRGWIPREGYEERVAALGGPAEVLGVALESAPFDASAPRSSDGLRWTQMAPKAMAEALGVTSPGWFLTQGPPEGRPAGELPATGYTLAQQGRPHLEYAGTWFLLAATLAGGALAVAFRRRRAAA